MSIRRICCTLAVLLLFGVPARAGQNEVRRINKDGNRLFTEEQWNEALAEYTAANDLDPDNPVLHYNLGNALYRLNDLDTAETHYRVAAAGEDAQLSRQARFNLGNTAFRKAETLEGAGDWQGRNQALGQALDHWKTVLETEPANGDAKRNLELALRKLREEPPENQQQQQQDQQDQEEQDQEEQQDQEQQQQEGNEQEEQDQQEEEQQGEQQQEEQQQQQGEEQQEEQQQQTGEQEEEQEQQQDQQQQEARISEEEAQRILDALRDEELDEQRRQMAERKGRGGSAERDW